MYPYRRSSTILSSLLLPATFLQDGPAAALDRLRDPTHRAALVSGPTLRAEVLDAVVLADVPDAPNWQLCARFASTTLARPC